MREVVITGIGVVGPHGVGMDSIVQGTREGRAVFSSWPESADPPHADALIASVGEYPKTRYFTERSLRLMDKPMGLSTFSAGVALEDAGFEDGAAPSDMATVIGTSRSEQTSVQKFLQPLVQGRPERINPAEFPLVARNISCGQIAIRFGLRGPSSVLASGGISSLEAVGRAATLIRTGRTDIALAGGVDVLSKFGLYFARHLFGDSLVAKQPQFFGSQPGCLVPSEGACMVILESAESASKRGARIYAKVSGWHAGRQGRGDPAQALRHCWVKAVPSDKPIDVFVSSAAGANRPHEQHELSALKAWALAQRSEIKVTAPRSLVGEGEAWTSALQVAVAAHSLSTREALPTRNVAPDAAPELIEATRGGALATGGALVSGVESSGSYCALHLEQV